MGYSVPRGSSCRIAFYPQGGVSVTELGRPVIAVKQELTFITKDAVVDAENNRIYVDLDESDTIQLVENVETQAQAVYLNDSSEIVYRFPIHSIMVTDTLFDEFFGLPDYIYTLVDPSIAGYSEMNPSEEGWYVLDGNDYVATENTSVIEGKDYYTRELDEL